MGLQGKERLVRTIEERTDRWVRAVALEGTGRVVMKTPVKEGRARGNWNVAVGAPDSSHDVDRLDKDGGPTIARGLSTITSVTNGDTIFITNSIPYIPALEGGHSSQASNGMVAVTVVELRPLADQIARKVRAGGE